MMYVTYFVLIDVSMLHFCCDICRHQLVIRTYLTLSSKLLWIICLKQITVFSIYFLWGRDRSKPFKYVDEKGFSFPIDEI